MDNSHSRTAVREIILKTLAAAGLLSVAILAPNALQALKIFEKGKKRKKNPKYVVNESIERLIKSGFLKYIGRDLNVVEITNKGQIYLQKSLNVGCNLVSKQKKWDKKWRLVIYDIKEYKKIIRDKLKFTLENFGFVRLQNSIWAYPYDCEDLINLLKADFQIGREILYVVADKIENDYWMRKIFELP